MTTPALLLVMAGLCSSVTIIPLETSGPPEAPPPRATSPERRSNLRQEYLRTLHNHNSDGRSYSDRIKPYEVRRLLRPSWDSHDGLRTPAGATYHDSHHESWQDDFSASGYGGPTRGAAKRTPHCKRHSEDRLGPQDVPLTSEASEILIDGNSGSSRDEHRKRSEFQRLPGAPGALVGAFRRAPTLHKDSLRFQRLRIAPEGVGEETEALWVREMVEAVIEREMNGCHLMLVHDGSHTHQLLLNHLLIYLPNLRQVVAALRVEDLAGAAWTSSCDGRGAYVFLLHRPETLISFLNTDDDCWNYQGRYFVVGLQVGDLEAVSRSKKGKKTPHLAGAVKSGVEGEWQVFMNQLYWGAGLRHITTWRRHSFTTQVDLFPDKVSDLRGALLKVVTFVWEPSVFYQRAEDGAVLFRYGTDILITEALGQVMNFTIQYQEPPNGEMWGLVSTNGTLTGLRGKLSRDEVDIGVANLYLTLNQRVGTEFSAPYDTESNCFLIRSEPPLPLWQALAFPFNPSTWLAVLFCLLLSGPVLYLLARGSAACGDEIPNLRTLASCFTFSLATLLGKSAARDPRPTSSRIVTFSLWLYGMILTIVYSTNLTAYLLVSRKPFTIDTFKDLQASGLRVFGLGDLFQYELAAASDPYLKELSKTYESHSAPEQIFPKVLGGEGVLLENHGFLEFSATTRFATRGASRVRILKNCFAPYNIAMGLQAHSPLKPKLDVVIGWVQQAGLVRRFFLDSMRLAAASKKYREVEGGPPGRDEGAVTPITLDHLQGAFLVALAGHVLSTVVFIVEKLLITPRSV
ncbi:probable glutamate receptor [Procambarus clarkii]|uniref:probable glutamate receptor n=1 Tax=Procambarus clarkii TaxID=6728 RepID=UPI003742433A